MSKKKFWDIKINNFAKPADAPDAPVQNEAGEPENTVEAELFLYGDVVESVPLDWWTGEKVPGDYIAQDEFLKDIQSIKLRGAKKLTVHINSCGGNLYTGSAIHDLLREMVDHVTVIIEGIAASAATVIAAAGDTVKMAKNGLYMIHEPSAMIFDNMTADDAEKLKNMLDAGAESAANAYAEKTGMSVKALRKMMKAETWMTGEEALEKGFVDELIESDVVMAMSAKDKLMVNGDTLTVGGYGNLPGDLKALLDEAKEADEETKEDEAEKADETENSDETVENDAETTADTNSDDSSVEENAEAPKTTDVAKEEIASGVKTVFSVQSFSETEDESDDIGGKVTPEDIEKWYPEAVEQIRNEATLAERKRIQDIDSIANQCDPAFLAKAKYEQPMDAKDFAFEVMRAGKISAISFLSANARDVEASNTFAVMPEAAETENEITTLAGKIAANHRKEGKEK